MSLTSTDLQEIRSIVEQVIQPTQSEIQALRNDIKEIYDEIAGLKSTITPDAQFQKFSLEQKLLKLNSELLAAAKQAGITLPR